MSTSSDLKCSDPTFPASRLFFMLMGVLSDVSHWLVSHGYLLFEDALALLFLYHLHRVDTLSCNISIPLYLAHQRCYEQCIVRGNRSAVFIHLLKRRSFIQQQCHMLPSPKDQIRRKEMLSLSIIYSCVIQQCHILPITHERRKECKKECPDPDSNRGSSDLRGR